MQINKLPQYWRSLSLKVKSLVISIVVIALLLTVLPYMVKFGLEKAMMNQGADKVTIEDVSLNLFTGRFKVKGLKAEEKGQPPLTLGEFFVDLDWSNLFKQRLVLERILLKHTNLKMTYHPDKFISIAGIQIPLTPTQPSPKNNEASSWRLGLNELTLEDSSLHIITPDMNKVIAFDQVQIDRLQNWAPDQPAQLMFHIKIGEKNVFGGFEGQFKLSPFSETQKMTGHIKIDNFLLEAYQNFLPKEIRKLSAQMNGNFDLAISNHFGEVSASVKSRMMTQNFAFDTDQLSASSRRIALNGTTRVHIKGDQVQLDSNSTLTVGRTDLKTPTQHFKFGSLMLKGQRNVHQTASDMELISDASLHLSDVVFQDTAQPQAVSAQLGDFNWQGKIQVNQNSEQGAASQKGQQPSASLRLNLTGKVGLKELGLVQSNVEASGKQVLWQGTVKVSPDKQTPSAINLQTDGQLDVSGGKVENSKRKLLLSSFDHFKSKVGFQSSNQQLALTNVQLDKLKVSKRRADKSPMVDINRISLDELGVKGKESFQLGQVDINGLDVNLVFDADKKLQQFNALTQSLPTEDKATKTVKKSESKGATSSKPIGFRLAGLDLSGKNRISILTYATSPKMDKQIYIQKFHIGKADSSEPTLKTPVTLNATIDKYTKLSTQGEVHPFMKKVNLALKTDVKELNLYSFSPLIERDLGYRIQSGSLNLQSDVKVKDDLLDSNNHVSLIGFKMAEGPADTKASSSKSDNEQQESGALAPGALKFGLDMLRDNNNNIKLDLPVKGNLSNPDFNASGAINIALKKALSGGTKLALMMALQPYGAIVMATNFAMNQANKIRFQPVAYQVGTTEMAEGMPEYLDKMGKLLKDKPQITLTVCGYYTDQDEAYFKNDGSTGNTLIEQLYDLAKFRQLLVKEWLVKKGGIASDRLTTCYPKRQDHPVTGVSLTM